LKSLKTFFIGIHIIFLLSSCNLGWQNNQGEEILSSNENPITTEIPLNPNPITTPSPHPIFISSSTPLSPSSTPNLCNLETGNITKKQLVSDFLAGPLEYRVYTPPCYESTSNHRYPVLYLIHGYGFNDDQWERLGVGEISDRLIMEGRISPFIIVMPHDNNHNVPPPMNQFGDAVVFELINEIDSSYQTLPIRHYRVIGGLSRGGNWAIHIGLTRWEYFGKIGANSAPLFVTDGPSWIKSWLGEIPFEDFPEIYMDIGDHDKWIAKLLQFEEILNDYNVPHELYLFPGNHTEDYWVSHVEQYISWYTKDW